MPENSNKPLKWMADIAQSADLYNSIQEVQELRQRGTINLEFSRLCLLKGKPSGSENQLKSGCPD